MSTSEKGAEAPNSVEEFEEPESAATVEEAIERWRGNDGRFSLIIPTTVKWGPHSLGCRSLYLLKLLGPDGGDIVWHGDTMVDAMKAAFEWEAKGYFPLIPCLSYYEVDQAMPAIEAEYA